MERRGAKDIADYLNTLAESFKRNHALGIEPPTSPGGPLVDRKWVEYMPGKWFHPQHGLRQQKLAPSTT